MSALGWTTVRTGRMNAIARGSSLPKIHVETGSNLPKPPSELPPNPPPFDPTPTDKMWDLPNTWPIVKMDIRYARDPDTSDQGNFGLDPQSPFLLGPQLRTIVARYSTILGPKFAAMSKPLHYVLMINGVDQSNPFDPVFPNPVTLNRNPLDGFVWSNPPLPVRIPTQSLLLRPNGTLRSRQFFGGTPTTNGAFDAMKKTLDDKGLPSPLLLLTDIETRGDVPGTVPYGMNLPGAPPPGLGFVEKAIASTPEAALTEHDSLIKWLNARRQTQDGGTLNPLSPLVDLAPASGALNDPINSEGLMLAFSAVTTNFATALSQGVFDHFRHAFGADKLCGEWDMYASTQDYQGVQYPLQRSHFIGSDIAITLQVPKNYSDLPQAMYSVNPGLFGRSVGWESVWNWLQVYQPPGFTPWASSPIVPNPNYPTGPAPDAASEMVQRVVVQTQTQLVGAIARAAPDKPLMPSVSIDFRQLTSEPPGSQDKRRAEATPFMVRYMLNCCARGARMFWLFAPNWNTGVVVDAVNAALPGQLIRDSNYTLVSTFNKRFKARVPRRNRMWRFTA